MEKAELNDIGLSATEPRLEEEDGKNAESNPKEKKNLSKKEKKTLMRKKFSFTPERVEAFSDALYSIIATILAVQIKLDTTEQAEIRQRAQDDGWDEAVLHFLEDRFLLLIAFFFSFAIIMKAWSNDATFMNGVQYLDESLVQLYIFRIFILSFFGFTTAFLDEYRDRPIGVLVWALGSLLSESILLLLIRFVHKMEYWKDHFSSMDRQRLYIPMVISILNTGLVCLLSIGLNINAMFFFFLSPVAITLAFFYLKKKDLQQWKISETKELFSKERVTALSDGIYAIAATIVILDLDLPIQKPFDGQPPSKLEDSNLSTTVPAYIATFFLITRIWYAHHTIYKLLKRNSVTVLILNILQLSLICLLPFLASLIIDFPQSPIGHVFYTSSMIMIKVFQLLQILFMRSNSAELLGKLTALKKFKIKWIIISQIAAILYLLIVLLLTVISAVVSSFEPRTLNYFLLGLFVVDTIVLSFKKKQFAKRLENMEEKDDESIHHENN